MDTDGPRTRGRRLSGFAAVGLIATLATTVGAGGAVATPARPAPAHPGQPVAPTAAVVPFTGGRAVVASPAGPDAATAAVLAAGGRVVDVLPLVRGVVADLPAGAVLPGCTVADDRRLAVAATSLPGDATAGSGAPISTARATLGLGPGSPRGAGVTVAVVDTGVADVGDLAGRVRHVDVTDTHSSGRRKSEQGGDDGFGHGTFVAGLVAGDGRASGGAYTGAAPAADVLDVKVADADGTTSLVSVLRGLQVVSASADALNVRVLNLSLSSGSPLPYQIDPLTQALEALWRQGITVVTAAGNDGPGAGTVSSPGLDPVLLTTGALDEAGSADRTDDTVAPYSSRGPAAQGVAKPDIVAPGSHLVSLRAPGSAIDTDNPGSRVAGDYFRGSGTSMSTALVSGVVADLVAARPELTPAQVKTLLTGTAYRPAGLGDGNAAGAGGVDAAAALAAPAPDVTDHPASDDGPPPGQAARWDRLASAMQDGNRREAAAAWRALSPEARSWVARSWVALSPEARSWVARSWVGRSWVGADGSADEWLARSWAARSWVARSWIARSWVGRSWVGDWAARSWTARSWTARSWTARSWTSTDWS